MGLKKGLLFMGLAFWAGPLAAQHSCLPDFNALQVREVFDLNLAHNFSYPFQSVNARGNFTTHVQLRGKYGTDHKLQLEALFDPNFQGVSLPYNLYAMLLVQNGSVVGWFDFTDGCQGPGIGFFPGQVIHLPRVQLSGGGKAAVQIMIWGRL